MRNRHDVARSVIWLVGIRQLGELPHSGRLHLPMLLPQRDGQRDGEVNVLGRVVPPSVCRRDRSQRA